MKFLAAMGIMAMFAAVMAAGIVFAVKGNPWLLIASFGTFLFLFAKVGCLHH